MMIVAHVVVADGDYVVVAAADAPAAAEIESNVIDWLRDDLHPRLSFLILFFHMMSLRLAGMGRILLGRRRRATC